MFVLAMSEGSVLAICGLVGSMFATFMTYITLRTKKTGETVDVIHKLVNNSYGISLKVGMDWIAKRVEEHPEDESAKEALQHATMLYNEHIAQQKIVDQENHRIV
jgi:hypothetical protein